MRTQYGFVRICEVTENEEYQRVNWHLELGWVLIAIRTEDRGIPENPDQKTVYCMGWPKSLGTPKYP